MFIQKGRFVFVVGMIVILAVVLGHYGPFIKPYYCGADGHMCKEIFNLALSFCVILIPVLIASIIAYKLPENLFQRFIKFTGYSYLVYCVIVLLTPWEVGGGSFSGPDFSKGLMAWFLSLVYFIAAIIYILMLRAKEKR